MKRNLMLFLAFLFLGIGFATAQTQTVTGVVVHASEGEPIIGAAVRVKDTNLGAVTDIDGKFTLTNVPASAKTLVVSYIGMLTQEVSIRPYVEVRLHDDTEQLEEVIVVGYGSAKKIGSVVGSISTVGGEKMEKTPTASFTDALSGAVSGLSVLSNSGDPSAEASVRLRGIGSINASTEPLYILDGAPISSTVFSTLNPSDIQNITVLKDATSTAIYGSRAAAGVIVITSKKGKLNEKATVTIRGQFGFSSIVKDRVEMMNSQQYIQFRDLIGSPVNQDVRDLVNNYGISTNWRDEIFDGSAPTYTIDASVRGGSDHTSYYLSLNHHSQEGVIDQSGMRRETIRFNFETRVNDWFKVGLNSNLGYTKYEQNNENNATDNLYIYNPSFYARAALPYDSPRFYTIENGQIVWGEEATSLAYSGFATIPYVNSTREVWRRNVTANLNLYEEITPIKGLTLRAQQAVDAYDYGVSATYLPSDALVNPMTGQTIMPSDTGSRSESFSRYYSFTYTHTAEYKFNIDDHYVTVLAGEESIYSKSNGFGVSSSGQSDSRLMLLTSGTNVDISSGLSHSIAEQAFNSIFFTGSYNYDEKYFFDASYRRDGSSNFAPGHRWSNFYSLGAMWNLKRENFLQDVNWLTDLSLKVSYGTTGNSSVGAYAYFSTLSPSGGMYNGGNSLLLGGNPGNEELTWEKTAQANVGVYGRFFNRFSLGADFYHKRTTDMLMTIPYSATTGYTAGIGNIGAMNNVGVDVEFSADLLQRKDFLWTFRANFNYNHNELTELFNGRDVYTLGDAYTSFQVGHSIGELYAVRRAGVDPRDGRQMWYDKDGNLTKTFNQERDAVLLGKDRYAPWTGGFGTALSWKGLTVSADFAWAAKKYMVSNDNYFIENSAQGLSINQTTNMLNIWTEPGQVTDIPKVGEVIQFDDHLIENASFLRLKNLRVQYSLPQRWMERSHMQNVTVFFTGRNLWTVTQFTGYDPEPDANLVRFAYPNTKQFIFGAEVTF